MENVVVASLGLVAQIANAVQNVCTLRKRSQTLGSHVSRLEPFLKEIRDKYKENHRFSPEAESLFRWLHDALEKAKKLVQDLKTTNRVKQFFMSKCLIDDLRDVSHDIEDCLSSLTKVTLQVSADGRDSLDEAKRNLEKLREDLNFESQEKALQLTGVVGKINMILEEQKSLPGLIQSTEPLMLLADVLNTGIDEVKKDLQGLRDCMTWRSKSKNATEDILFKWTLMAMGESWSSTVNSPANFQKALACPICREVFKDPVVISSGYTYCFMCIEKHSKNDNKCPVTREVVSLDRFPNRALDEVRWYNKPERSLECRAAAAHGLCNLLSLNLTQDLDVDGPLLQPTVNKWKARVAERRGVDFLLGVAGSIQCIEAVQALAAVSDNESAKTQLVERVPEVLSMCLKGDRVQELVLKIFLYLSRGSLSKDSVSSLVADGFPAIILRVLRTPTLASVTTAIKIVRNLSVESEEFTKVMLSTDEGAVKLLLAVLREPSGTDEIRECSVLALEMFMKEEKGRQQLMDADGIALLATELQRRPGCEQAKFYSLKVLLRLADPLIPKASKKLVWNMICTSDIFGAVGKGMDDNIPESNTPRTAVELLRACINETSDVSALCRRLEEASVYRSLANLRHQGHVEANEVVNLLVKKSKSARHALKKESRKLDDADDSFSSLAGGSPSSHSHRSIGFRD